MWANRPGLWALARRYTCLPNLKSYCGNGGSLSGLWVLSCIESSDLATIACDYNYTYTYTPTYTPKPKHCCPHCFHGATMHCLAPGPTRALYFLYTYVCLIYTCTPTQNRRTCACTAAQTSYFGASRQTWLPDRASAALRLKQPNCCVGRLLLRAI